LGQIFYCYVIDWEGGTCGRVSTEETIINAEMGAFAFYGCKNLGPDGEKSKY
jgi:hypothetical protein